MSTSVSSSTAQAPLLVSAPSMTGTASSPSSALAVASFSSSSSSLSLSAAVTSPANTLENTSARIILASTTALSSPGTPTPAVASPVVTREVEESPRYRVLDITINSALQVALDEKVASILKRLKNSNLTFIFSYSIIPFCGPQRNLLPKDNLNAIKITFPIAQLTRTLSIESLLNSYPMDQQGIQKLFQLEKTIKIKFDHAYVKPSLYFDLIQKTYTFEEVGVELKEFDPDTLDELKS